MTEQALITPMGRLAFVGGLFEPRAPANNKQERYSVTILWPPHVQETEAFTEMRKAFGAAAREKWGQKMPKDLQSPFKPAEDGLNKDGERWQGFEDGWVFMRAWSHFAPGIVDPTNKEIMSQNDVFSGMWGRLDVTPHAFDNQTRGVCAMLNHCQFILMDGPKVERLDGKGSPGKRFGELPPEVQKELDEARAAGQTGGSNFDQSNEIPF